MPMVWARLHLTQSCGSEPVGRRCTISDGAGGRGGVNRSLGRPGGVGIGTSNLASLLPQSKGLRQALTDAGVKVTAFQEKPPLVDNFRPYMEELKGAGTVGLDELSGQDP